MTSIAKKLVSLVAVVAIMGSAAIPAFAASSTLPGTNVSRLGELIVLDNLFGGGTNTTGTVSGTNVSRLGELIVLDNLFGGGTTAMSPNGRVSRLGELIVLDNLFMPVDP